MPRVDDSGARAAARVAYDSTKAVNFALDEDALNAALDAYQAVLAATGQLHPHEPEPEPVDDDRRELTVEEAAHWLGDVSNHPRYTGDRWRRLLVDSLDHATACARRRYADDQPMLADITRVYDLLDRHQKANPQPR